MVSQSSRDNEALLQTFSNQMHLSGGFDHDSSDISDDDEIEE